MSFWMTVLAALIGTMLGTLALIGFFSALEKCTQIRYTRQCKQREAIEAAAELAVARRSKT